MSTTEPTRIKDRDYIYTYRALKGLGLSTTEAIKETNQLYIENITND